MLKDNYITGLKMQVSNFYVLNIVDKFEMFFYIEYASVTYVTMVTKSVTQFINV